jgi:hypothetical protein
VRNLGGALGALRLSLGWQGVPGGRTGIPGDHGGRFVERLTIRVGLEQTQFTAREGAMRWISEARIEAS